MIFPFAYECACPRAGMGVCVCVLSIVNNAFIAFSLIGPEWSFIPLLFRVLCCVERARSFSYCMLTQRLRAIGKIWYQRMLERWLQQCQRQHKQHNMLNVIKPGSVQTHYEGSHSDLEKECVCVCHSNTSNWNVTHEHLACVLHFPHTLCWPLSLAVAPLLQLSFGIYLCGSAGDQFLCVCVCIMYFENSPPFQFILDYFSLECSFFCILLPPLFVQFIW